MFAKSVNDSYVDAFSGRIPSGMLSKHYLDFETKIEDICDNVNLEVLT